MRKHIAILVKRFTNWIEETSIRFVSKYSLFFYNVLNVTKIIYDEIFTFLNPGQDTISWLPACYIQLFRNWCALQVRLSCMAFWIAFTCSNSFSFFTIRIAWFKVSNPQESLFGRGWLFIAIFLDFPDA